MGFGCTREDVSTVMSLFAEVIETPNLSETKLELLKAQVQQPVPLTLAADLALTL